jgi:GNAT superfamily N-acetyltransferase
VHAAERAELEALHDLYAACPGDVAARLGAHARATGASLAFSCTFLAGARELNRVVGASTAKELDAAEDFFGELGIPFHVSVMPGTGLEGELEPRGYEPGYAWMKFIRPAGDRPASPTELRIEEVGSGRATDFAATCCAGYGFPEELVPWTASVVGRPGWHCFASYDGDRVVGTGGVFAGGELAWLGFAATLPEARGHGSQSAILARRIERATELGCALIVTETGARVEGRPSGSYRNLLRAGFEEAYLRPNYRSPRRRR